MFVFSIAKLGSILVYFVLLRNFWRVENDSFGAFCVLLFMRLILRFLCVLLVISISVSVGGFFSCIRLLYSGIQLLWSCFV